MFKKGVVNRGYGENTFLNGSVYQIASTLKEKKVSDLIARDENEFEEEKKIMLGKDVRAQRRTNRDEFIN